MRRFLFIVFSAIVSITALAQSKDPSVFYVEIPEMLDIKDRIIVQNKSPYCIQQMVVALPHGVQMEVFGTITYLDPDKIVELANYKRKSIETLKGKKLAIKLRGLKKVEGSFDDFTDPSLETYDFAIVVYEEEKDLYFEIVNRGDIKVDEEEVDTTYLFDKKKKS